MLRAMRSKGGCVMSDQNNQGFKGIPGVPDGWELVAISQIDNRQWSIDDAGGPYQWRGDKSNGVYPIIRKIKKPKQYRPIVNGVEYIAKRRDGIAVDWKLEDGITGFFAVVSANDSFVWVAFGDVIERFDWQQAFEKLEFRHIDNSTSPFGVEVTQ
jgi:hypothetical protein